MADAASPDVHDLPGLVINRIFHSLNPRDLAVASAVSRAWRHYGNDALSNRLWCSHYQQRWRPVPSAGQRWQVRYGAKLAQLQSFRGRYQADRMAGHAGGVRCVGLLPSQNLLATGSSDRTVRLWDLQAGLQRAASRCLGGIVRSLAIDDAMLVAGTSQDYGLQVWRAEGSSGADGFHLKKPCKPAALHNGPVSSVALGLRLYSGSWDYSVRVWSRDTLECLALLSFPDWVDCVQPRGNNLLVAAGPNVFIHSLETAQRVRVIACPPDSVDATARLCLEGRRDSRMLFTGTATGQVLAHDLRAPGIKPVALLGSHHDPVSALSMEDPWLAAAHGSLTLIDVDAAMRGGRSGSSGTSSSVGLQAHQSAAEAAAVPAATRQLPGQLPAHCVDISSAWIAAGSNSRAGVVQTLDFTHAAAAEARAQAAKQGRRAARQARAELNSQRAAASAARAAASHDSAAADAGLISSSRRMADAAVSVMPVTTAPLEAATGSSPAGVALSAEDPSRCSSSGSAAGELLPMQDCQSSHVVSLKSEQPVRNLPRWRIIRPERCKYRHVEPDPWEEVEVGA